jgi:hypothetical protein
MVLNIKNNFDGLNVITKQLLKYRANVQKRK